MRVQTSLENKTVWISTRAHAAFVNRSVAPRILPLLQRLEYRFAVRGTSGIDHRIHIINHFQIDLDRIWFSAGLVPRVRQELEAAGHVVKIQDLSFWGHLNDANRHLLHAADLSDSERLLVARLSEAPQGQILLSKPSQTARHIALMTRLFAHHSLLIIACNTTNRDRLVEEIAKHTDRPITSNPREAWRHCPRVLVSTLQLTRNAGGDDFQIIVCTDAETALSEAANALPLPRWSNATWYAFGFSGRTLHVNEDLQLEEVFGPVIHQTERAHSLEPPSVEVLFREGPPAERPQESDSLSRKRALYWQNPEWNNAVCSALDYLNSQRVGKSQAEKSETSRCAILVESTEHGKALNRMLPNWKLRTMLDFASCIPAISGQEIATMSCAAAYGISADVLIRADGGPDWPLGNALAIHTLESHNKVLLFDFCDRRDKRATRDSESRQHAYQRMGWASRDFCKARDPRTCTTTRRATSE